MKTDLKEIKKAVELNYCFTTENWARKQVRNPQEDERWLIAEIERLRKVIKNLNALRRNDQHLTERAEAELNTMIELEASVCPEDFGCHEYIPKLEARVKFLEKGLMKKLVDNAKRARIVLEKKLGGKS